MTKGVRTRVAQLDPFHRTPPRAPPTASPRKPSEISQVRDTLRVTGPAFNLTHAHTLTLSHSLTRTLSHTHSHTHTHTLSLSRTQTHTHTHSQVRDKPSEIPAPSKARVGGGAPSALLCSPVGTQGGGGDGGGERGEETAPEKHIRRTRDAVHSISYTPSTPNPLGSCP